MLAAAEAAGVSNLWVHPGDALPFITDRVPAASLAAVHLFFPDPWPKNKHAKRRFVQQHTLDLLASRLVPGGVLRIATDIAAYAEHARTQLAHHGRWDVVEGERPDWRPDDGFEAKGVRAGRTVVYGRDGRPYGDPALVRLGEEAGGFRDREPWRSSLGWLDWVSRIGALLGLAGAIFTRR